MTDEDARLAVLCKHFGKDVEDVLCGEGASVEEIADMLGFLVGLIERISFTTAQYTQSGDKDNAFLVYARSITHTMNEFALRRDLIAEKMSQMQVE